MQSLKILKIFSLLFILIPTTLLALELKPQAEVYLERKVYSVHQLAELFNSSINCGLAQNRTQVKKYCADGGNVIKYGHFLNDKAYMSYRSFIFSSSGVWNTHGRWTKSISSKASKKILLKNLILIGYYQFM